MAHVQEPSPPVVDASDRIPEAPILGVTLSCPPTLEWDRTPFRIQAKVAYLGVSDSSSTHSAEPITFNNYPFFEDEGLFRGIQLFHFHDDHWEVVDDEGHGGFGIADDPDVAVCPANHESFISLAPEESWTFNRLIQKEMWNILPLKTKLGDKFRFIAR
ncbi:unnamed protein product [Clonostachys solani]|uniref:Uncharacterized protein n=1 Tax=Clonostachys solani TaxID=160281 RepID=A0A9P0EHA6_9HYPO|nr:unnamed protein product [Clonostachys solani]